MAGRHRAPSNTGARLRRLGTVGIVATTPLLLGSTNAQAEVATDILEAIAQCESGNRNIPNSTGASTASGYLQIVNGTWAAHGGTEFSTRAIGASREEQFIVGARILAGQGLSAWSESKSCWSKKSGSPSRTVQPVVEKPAPTPKKPASALKNRAPKPAPKTAVSTKNTAKRVAKSYVIKKGDTLTHIARCNKTSVRGLVNLNRDTVKNPDLIYAGKRLRVG